MDVNAKDIHRRTALHYAALNNNKEIVELLIAHDIDINAMDKHEIRALDLAKENNCDEVTELLIMHGAF